MASTSLLSLSALRWSSYVEVLLVGGLLVGGKESTYNVGDLGLVPGLGRFPGEGEERKK